MENPNSLLTRIENTRLWTYFHKDWLLQMRAQLRLRLPAHYHVFVESETVLISPDGPTSQMAALPDVAISRRHPAATEAANQSLRGTLAVVEIEEPCEVCSKYSLLIRRAPDHQVVAALELLSPSNKGVGNRFDQEKHLRKRNSFLEAGMNLLEIDALLGGERAVPAALQRDLAQFERVAWTASHEGGRRRLSGWGWHPQDALPTLCWTVESGLDVLVDLDETLAEACAFNRWEELVASVESGL